MAMAFMSAGFVMQPAAIAQDATPVAATEEDKTAARIKESGEFVEIMVDDLREVALARENGEDADLAAVFGRNLDIQGMQRRILSKSARQSATDEEKAAYEELFPSYIAIIYADSIDNLVSRVIKVDDVIAHRSGAMIVKSRLFDKKGKPRVGIDWILRYKGDTPVLFDVSVDGQQKNTDLRAQFGSIVKRDGFGALVTHMQDKIDGKETPA